MINNSLFYKFLIALILVSVPFASLLAQSVAEIKNNNSYVWGEGIGLTVDEAEQAALAQMSRSISVSIFNMSLDADENGNSMQKSVLQSVSSAKFSNVQIKVLSEEPKARIFCYVHKEDVMKMFRQREQRISDLIETGKTAEERLQIDDALRCYYWALALSKLNPEPVKVSFGNQQGLSSSLLPAKIKSVLNMIKAEITDGEDNGNGVNARIRFKYNGKDVSSLQFNYNDGQSIVGPVSAKDGIGEVDLVSFPANGKLHITYETRFKNEVDPLDADLCGIYATGKLPSLNASDEISVKRKGNYVKAGKPDKAKTVSDNIISAQPTKEKTPIQVKNVPDPEMLHRAVLEVENAIKAGKPKLAYQRFTPNGYKLFCKLMNETGHVSLSGTSNYEFVEADGYLIGRATRIKIKFRNGRAFMENLVYRFDPHTRKIESVAFALTKRAENDIMNAAASWPEVSRWAILNFMEDYQTAFALKRLDYISSIFSDNAIIITGTVLKNMDITDQVFDRNKIVDLGVRPKNVKYSRHTKAEYIQRLGEIFKDREYVHLTFENNITKLIDLPKVVVRGAAFGIEIKQRYTSSSYSDEGYLTLVFDTRGEHPVIHVRLWQPDKADMVSLQEFISKFTN